MMFVRCISRSAVALSLLMCCAQASGQEYPSKPIRMMAGEAGGGADFLARLVAQGLSAGLRQQVLVDNRPGNVVLPVEALINAAPDGYTLLFYSNSVWVQPFLQNVRYDPVRDIAPVVLAVSTPNVLAVHPSVPVRSTAELIGLANRQPGKLNMAAGGFGSAVHLGAELLKSMAGIKLIYVPYKGGGPALTATISGEVSVLLATTSSVLPHARSGRLRALAVTSAQPSELAPGLPTVAATVPGYESAVKFALLAPGKTPAAVIARVNREFVQYVSNPEVREQFFKVGAEPVGGSPQDLATYIKTDMSLMSKVIKEAAIKLPN